MRALVYGVRPEPQPEPDGDNHLLTGLARTPMRLLEVDDPPFLGPDWVVLRPRMTGICGSDAKQVFMDFGEDVARDNPMGDFFSMPQVLGHEVVADVVSIGKEASGVEVGDRVVLNPWLSCGPRGISPPCPACDAGDLSLCWNFAKGRVAPGIHSGTSRD
ncbi:MAG: alcohol dehydrogenase catalytic domain-containing protein, partial [Acidimicrobiia bacterium]|nr:alcohol dehydrogenase catalytic domain-containing protein [Acidimicrobiia bacterium]